MSRPFAPGHDPRRNLAGRPRKHVDPAKLARAHELWLARRLSLSSAARVAGTTRDVLRRRFPEFAEWRAANNAAMRARYHERRVGDAA